MKFIYSGRGMGRNLYYHEWFRDLIPTLKSGWTMGIPTKDGIAVFKFMGIRKPKSEIKYCGCEELRGGR